MSDIESIFIEAKTLSGDAREAYLNNACGNDLALRNKVEHLLKADLEAGSFLSSEEDDDDDADATLIQAASNESEGQRIDRYELLQQIGEGGFGTVWMAEQKEPVKRRVALKIIKLGMDTRQVIARFEAERQALAMMDHPNIAKVLDAGTTETGRPYFVMELVKGVPVLEYCDSEMLDTNHRLDLFMQVCNAIQHAHQKGIIHRDIKPSNVLVTLHDGTPVVKVIDFGIAKATNTELTQKTLFTEHRQMIGTPAYMSPEQAAMSGLDIDTRSDVYSLGVLLYELLTGTTPFDTKELMSAGFAEMMRIIREVEPHKPSTRLSTLGETGTRTAQIRGADVKKLGSTLRGDLDWIVMKCLEKDRGRRYETANGLAADIQRHLTGDAVLAAPPSNVYRLRKFVRRNRAQVAVGSIIAAVLVLGIIGTSAGLVWALQERDRADALARTEAAARSEAVMAAERATEERSRAEQASVLAQEEARTSQAITDFTLNLLGLANPDVSRSPNMTVRELLDSAGAEVGAMLAGQPRAELFMRTSIAHAYLVMGDTDAALEHVDRVMELLDVIPDMTPIDRWEPLLVNLFVQVDLGETWGNALQQFWDNLELAIIDMMPSIKEPLLEMRRVAGDPAARDEALAVLAQVNDIMESIPVEEDTLRLYIVNYVHASGSRWASRLHWRTAIEYLEWSVHAYQSTTFATHSYSARSVVLLADGYQSTGQPEKAIALLSEQADRLAGVLPDGHPMVQHMLLLLGRSLVRAEQYEEAELVILPAAEQLRRDFDSVNPNHTFAMRELIEFFEQSGQEHRIGSLREELAIQSAMRNYATTLLLSGAAYPPEHQPFYDVLLEVNRHHVFKTLPDSELIEQLLEQRQAIPDESPLAAVTADLIRRYAHRFREDHPELAEPMYREVLRILRVNEHAHGSKLGRTQRYLARTLRALGRNEEAAELAKAAIPLLAQWHGTHNYRTLEAHRLRGNCLTDLGQYAEAEQHLLRSYEGRLEEFGPAYFRAVSSFLDLIHLYSQWRGAQVADAFILQHLPVHLEEPSLSARRLRNITREIVRLPEYSLASYEIALAAAERALEMEPENQSTWSALGRAQFRLGRFEQAAASLSRAVDNGVSGLFFDSAFLAMTQYRLGDKVNARMNLQQFRTDVLERGSSPFFQPFIDEVEQTIGHLLPQE